MVEISIWKSSNGSFGKELADAPKGKPFQECYDARTARPMPWYLDMYQKVKSELAEMGVEFPY